MFFFISSAMGRDYRQIERGQKSESEKGRERKEGESEKERERE